MTKYKVNGSNVFLANDLDLKMEDRLPVDTYQVSFHPDMGFYLTVAQPFTMPSKLYGDTEKMADRILNTYEDRPGTTGVLLSGVKGSGKSLLMKRAAQKALLKNIPVIIVNAAYSGTSFNSFIQSIEQETVIIFDEFEKVYNEQEKQEQLLTLFDGVYSSKKLFILTANDAYKINSYMNNRPGRIYYAIEYRGLTPEFIREYCDDILTDKGYTNQIVLFASLFQDFNFDMLKALCEELNRYGEPLKEALHVLNIKHERSYIYYDVTVIVDGEKVSKDYVGTTSVNNPFGQSSFVVGYNDPNKHEDDEDAWIEHVCEPYDDKTIKSGDLTRIEFNPTKSIKIVLDRQKNEAPLYHKLM